MTNFEFKIDDYLEERTELKQPGFALAIIKDNELVFKGSYGYSNLEHDVKVTGETVFYLCSLSKQFTAACLAFLLNEKKLKKDDKLIEFFPTLQERIYGKIRLDHLIHMSSGIREWYDMKKFSGAYADEYPWRASIIPLLQRQESLSFQPGEKYIYCNTNYALLTLIIEQVIKGSIVDFAAARIFQPLGLNDTFFSNSNSKVIPGLATGYNCRGENINKTVPLPPLVGAGGVYSSLQDMTIWLKILMTESWEPEMIRTLKEHILFNNGNPNPYLMGLEMGRIENYEYIQHGGAVPGFFTYIRFYPESETGYVWLQNSHDIQPVVINCQIHGQLLDQGFLKESEPVDYGTDKYDDFTGDYIDLVTGRGKDLKVVNGKLNIYKQCSDFFQF